MDIRDLLEKVDSKLYKVRSTDIDCPLSRIIPKKKETKSITLETNLLIAQ